MYYSCFEAGGVVLGRVPCVGAPTLSLFQFVLMELSWDRGRECESGSCFSSQQAV